MAKQTINIGSGANAGNGDPLRLAFIKINDNFEELSIRTVSVPVTSKGATGDSAGDVAFNGTHFYYCTAAYTSGLSDIWRRVAWAVESW